MKRLKDKYFCNDENCLICRTGGYHISLNECLVWTAIFGLIIFFAN